MIAFLRKIFGAPAPETSAKSATASGEMIAFPIVVNPSPDERQALAVARLGHIERFLKECEEQGIKLADDCLEHFRHEVAALTAQLGMASLKKD